MNRRLALLLSLLAVVAALMACGNIGNIPTPPPAQTPCAANCPPLVGNGESLQEITTNHFSLYYHPSRWKVDSQDQNSVVLVRDSTYGQISAQFFAQTVPSGTTADQLLTAWAQRNLDAQRFTGLQDFGEVRGAEIGYVAGAGRQYGAYYSQPNAPNVPIFLQAIASTQGTTGIIFVAVSPLDSRRPDPSDPRAVASGAYDQLINTLVWL